MDAGELIQHVVADTTKDLLAPANGNGALASDASDPHIGSLVTGPYTNTTGALIRLHPPTGALVIQNGQTVMLSGRVSERRGFKVIEIPGDCGGFLGDGKCYFPMSVHRQ